MKTMMALALAAAALLAWETRAEADGQILPSCEYQWTQPTLNMDGSPLVDLKEFRVYMATSPGSAGVRMATVPAPAAAPIDGAVYKWGCSGNIVDGQKYATVTAVNLQNVESTRSNEVPFVLQRPIPASAPSGLVVAPHQ